MSHRLARLPFVLAALVALVLIGALMAIVAGGPEREQPFGADLQWLSL